MDTLVIFFSIAQSFSVSLGVGASTLAVTQFLVAIANGNITKEERKMLGVVYVLLRIAMCAITVATLLITIYSILAVGFDVFTGFSFALWTLIIMLFVNAFLMSKHIMPSKFGPAIQAGTWYTLGGIFALAPLGLTNFSYIQFLTGYLLMIALAVLVINGIVRVLKKNK